MATTPIVRSSHAAATASGSSVNEQTEGCTKRGSTSKKRKNFSQHAWKAVEITRLG